MSSIILCTETGCRRGAVLTIVNPLTGNGGHVCQEHAEMWAADFLLRSAAARIAAGRDKPRLVTVPGTIKRQD